MKRRVYHSYRDYWDYSPESAAVRQVFLKCADDVITEEQVKNVMLPVIRYLREGNVDNDGMRSGGRKLPDS